MNAIWYGDKPPGVLLRSLSRLYRSTIESRRRKHLSEQPPDLVGKPVIVVGNLTVGGTGKTPLVMHLCQSLKQAGHNPAVISRGYGRKSRDAIKVGAGTPVSDAGDEPLLIARSCDVPVFVDRDREQAARDALSWGADVVIADDGLQRMRLPRVFEICVVDGSRGFGNGLLLPSGPLREPVERLDAVDAIVVNGQSKPLELNHETVQMNIVPGEFHNLRDPDKRLSIAEMRQHCEGKNVTAVAGIGNPERFFKTLEESGLTLDERLPLDDHARLEEDRAVELKGTILMTGKDAVKCDELELKDVWWLSVSASVPDTLVNLIKERLSDSDAVSSQ